MQSSDQRPVQAVAEPVAKKRNGKYRAIFLDRDGTIIEQVELLHEESEIKVLPGAAQAIREMNQLGYRVIVITNQPVVARGVIGPKDVEHLNAFLADRLAEEGARIDASYFCPHHPQANVEEYRMACACRKPEPGMILAAACDHDIDLGKSFFIGDSTKDTLAANRAGVKAILVETGHGGKDVWQHDGKPDFVAKDLLHAMQFIKEASSKK